VNTEKARYRDHTVNFKNPETFIDWKIEMLRDDFRIKITDEEIAHLRTFKTENSINGAVRKIMDTHWG
jgi:hypothetical protein